MIKVKNLRKEYISNDIANLVLDNINLEVNDGEIFGIIGHSGAGKSSLLRCLNLLEEPTDGSVFVAGDDITKKNAAALRKFRKNIGMIFQHFNLLSSRTVFENIALPLEIQGQKKDAIRKRVSELLDLVELPGKASAYPNELSGGQKQKVAIARALASNPVVLLSDEATSALVATVIACLSVIFFAGIKIAIPFLIIVVIVLVKHKDNIKRLVKGEESKIGDKTKK